MSKLKKIIAILVITIFMIGFLSSLNVVKAADQVNLGIIAYRMGGEDFYANDKQGTHIFKVVEFNGTEGTSTAVLNDNVYYCIKFGQGFGGSNTNPKVYNDVGDLKNKSSIASTYANQIEWLNTNRYSAIMWLVDNMYLGVSKANTSNAAERQAYLTKVKNYWQDIIDYVEDNDSFPNQTVEEVLEQGRLDITYWDLMSQHLMQLSNDEIDAVQQMAIWYFTNNGGTLGNITNLEATEFLKTQFQKYTASAPESPNTERNDGMLALFYYYIINGIEAAKSNYTPTSDDPHVLDITAPSQSATLTENSGTYEYLAGPFKFTGNNLPSSLQVTGVVKVNDATAAVGTNGVTAFKIGTKNGNTVTEKTLEEIINSASKEFYIWVKASNELNTIGIDITTTISARTARYYSVASEVSVNQPVLKIDGSNKSFPIDAKVGVQKNNKSFDLALRKYITAINNIPVNTRIPDPDVSKLKTGEKTTADYYHRKNPLEVEVGQKVQYTIRVYNEGEVDGYVDEITDYLPPNLELDITDTTNLANGWRIPDPNNSHIVSTRQFGTKAEIGEGNPTLLRKFETSLSYIDVPIVCIVVPTDTMPDEITNIAEITMFSDSDGNTITDRDSQARNVNTAPEFPSSQTDSKWSTYKDSEIAEKERIGTRYYIPGNQDDDDFEKLKIKELDLALRKNIASIDGVEPTNRKPAPNTNRLNNPDTTAIYNHRKNPLTVEEGSVVIYTITVYNEGAVDGYAGEITDHLPPNLQFIEGHEINTRYGWTHDAATHTAKTTYLAYKDGSTENLLKAFTTTQSLADPAKNGFKTVQIACRVVVTDPMPDEITNIAEISKYQSKTGATLSKDRDSVPANVNTASEFPSSQTDSKWSTYKDTEIEAQTQNTYYIPGNEDDDDFEKVKLKQPEFDLALRKFITKINDTEVSSRIPKVDTTPLKNGGKTASYKHAKDPLKVNVGDIVEYTIRVYNEGEVDGYAEQVTDFLPEQLEFIAESNSGWTYEEATRKITTDLLSKAKAESNLITHYNGGDTLDYKELKVVCKVVKTTPMPNVITNIAAVTDDADKDGNEVKDRDSSPEDSPNVPSSELPDYKGNELNKDDLTDENYYYKGQEDDDDFEKLTLNQFDLALRKFISSVNGVAPEKSREPVVDTSGLKSGKTTAIYTHTKEPLKVAVGDKVVYTLRIYNEGDVDGYANEITDYVPEQLEYVQDSEINEQYGWTYESATRKVTTDYLSYEKDREGNLIEAYDSGSSLDYKDVKIEFIIKKTANMPSKITNIAEITEDKNGNGEDVDDRDSTPDDLVKPEDWPGYKDDEIDKPYVPGQEDDDDFEKVVLKEFDLALRKFISQVGDTEVTSRIPQVDVTPLKNGETTAIYNHPKTPLEVSIGSTIVYTLRVYNEGEIDGYANEITDYVPEQLEYVTDSEINTQYGWKYDKNTREVSTDYLSYEKNREGNVIKAYDGGNTLNYKDVKIEFRLVSTENMPKKITNIAEVTEDKNDDGEDVDDRDSTPDDIKKPEDWPGYKDDEIDKPYVPGQEDDDDFEKVIIKEFDLALRKFITKIGDTEVTSRIPQVDVTPLKEGKTTATYTHPKDALLVANGVIVEYTIRIYNEGEVDGYATEITDDIPKGLEFLPDHETNKKYGWNKVEGKDEIRTRYLEGELIKAFDGEKLDYKDVVIAFKVIEPTTSDRIITNYAQISEDKDKDGKDVKDRDSTPDEWKGEDDEDIENIKVTYFDLALRKWVTQAIVTDENGKTTVTETGHKAEDDPEQVVKVDLKNSKINKVTVKFRYSIRVTNEGKIAGYVKEIKDYIPEGLKFVQEDNPNWKALEGNQVVTEECKDVLLKPGESTEVTIILTWINGANNMGLKDNWAEISKDYNDYDAPDIDSTPNNDKKGEDDIDDAPVILQVQTGEALRYVVLTIGCLGILIGGISLIKKYVD